MARTNSTMMLKLGQPAPDFLLPDTVGGEDISLSKNAGAQGSLVMFICNHCPFVVHLIKEIGNIDKDYDGRGISIFAINSNDIDKHPDDAPDKMAALARSEGWSFPYLFDASQETAKRYGAACTPDFFLLDSSGKLVFRGRMDGSSPGNEVPVTGEDLRAALDALLSGAQIGEQQLPSLGCNIKWKPCNEPSYFG